MLATAGLGLLSACSYTNASDVPPTPCSLPEKVSYQTDVLPILKQNCYACHSAKSYQASSGGALNMEDFSQVNHYSTTGPGKVSFMVGNIRHDAAPGYVAMPYGGGKLSDCEIATIEAWVNAGASQN